MWHRSTALWFGAIAFVAGLASVDRVAGQSSGKPQTPKTVRLYVFDCGSLNIPDTTPYQFKKEELATTYMSVACFLVAHPKGTLMWDVGAVPDSAFKGSVPGTLRYASTSKTLTSDRKSVV